MPMKGYKFIRTCQACGFELDCKGESKRKDTRAYTERRCPKCKSEAFDFGSWRIEGSKFDYKEEGYDE